MVLGATFDAAETLREVFASNEAFELDEIVLGLAAVGLLGFWYAARRWADQKAQVAQLQDLRMSLVQSNVDLTQASAAKSVFLAQMSHELRTPLNAVIGFSEALDAGLYGPLTDKQSETVQSIGVSGRILLDLVADILDMARIEAGQVELAPETTDLQSIVRQSISAVEDDARHYNAALRIETDGSRPKVAVDRARTRQMLVNLLTNAIRYGRSDQPIRIRVASGSTPDTAVVAVIDQGPGMTADQLVDATKPFVAFAGRELPGAGRAGLGLSITSGLAALQGGRLDLKSRPGAGTTAQLHLPLAEAAEVEATESRMIALAS